MKELKIELADHIGQKNVDFGNEKMEVDINFDQYSIMVNGKEVGLVCKADGAPINFLPIANVFPKEVREKIAEAVVAELANRKLGEKDRKTFHPPSNEAVAAANAAIAKQAAKEAGEDTADENNL